MLLSDTQTTMMYSYWNISKQIALDSVLRVDMVPATAVACAIGAAFGLFCLVWVVIQILSIRRGIKLMKKNKKLIQ